MKMDKTSVSEEFINWQGVRETNVTTVYTELYRRGQRIEQVPRRCRRVCQEEPMPHSVMNKCILSVSLLPSTIPDQQAAAAVGEHLSCGPFQGMGAVRKQVTQQVGMSAKKNEAEWRAESGQHGTHAILSSIECN